MKTIDVAPLQGRYVLAVSGGVDSVVLLDILAATQGLNITVAHYDHGIRHDSAKDRRLVQKLARSYGLPCVYQEGNLGSGASEDTARRARYQFLRATQKAANAIGIITAHHQDDLLETAILNLLRGTGRHGLGALKSTADLARPLLDVPKSTIVTYAQTKHLEWREDSTNQDETHARNYIRAKVMPRFDENARAQLVQIVTENRQVNHELDAGLMSLLDTHSQSERIDHLERGWFAAQSWVLSREVLAVWLRRNDLAGFDRKTIERLTVQFKTLSPGHTVPIYDGHDVIIGKQFLALNRSER